MSPFEPLCQLRQGHVWLPGDGSPQKLLDVCRQQPHGPMPRLGRPLGFSALELLAAYLLRKSVTDTEHRGQFFQASTSSSIGFQKLRAHVIGIGFWHVRSSPSLATLTLKQISLAGYNY